MVSPTLSGGGAASESGARGVFWSPGCPLDRAAGTPASSICVPLFPSQEVYSSALLCAPAVTCCLTAGLKATANRPRPKTYRTGSCIKFFFMSKFSQVLDIVTEG